MDKLKKNIDEFFCLLLDYLPDNKNHKKIEELYEKISSEADIEVDVGNFTSTIRVITDDKEYEGITNAISGNYFKEWMLMYNGEPDISFVSNYYEIQAKCATCPLDEITAELTDDALDKVFKGHNIISFDYLLLNPRKEVVEWVLEHKDELCLHNVEYSFIKKYQAIPELQKTILATL